MLGAAASVQAHESEQYSLPAGRDFADLGPLFSRNFLAAIRDAVADTNAAIDAALAAGDRPTQVLALQAPNQVAGQVWARIFVTYPANETLDLGLLSAAVRAQYPGLVTMYRPVDSIYDDPLLMLDLSKPVRALFRAGTVNAGGMLFGTDKIIHFINVGRIYHQRYLDGVAEGMDETQAARYAVSATAATPLVSEDGLLGLWTTGIRSNGDLAADYAGMTFYRNLTEPVRLGAVRLLPMLQRDGEHWRVVVQDEDTVFTRFVSPHWNEVLNPNSYLGYVGDRVRSIVASRCDDVADWYRDAGGQPLVTAWFAARQRELATFHGKPYGHQLPADKPVSVADICRGDEALRGSIGVDAPLWWGGALPGGRVDSLGRSALWQAAAAGRSDEAEGLVASGDPLDAADIDGETALHAALRRGHPRTAMLLVARGADANRAAQHGVTPLLLAVAGGHAELVDVLLQAGADPNAQDRFGRTALHQAAQRGDLAVAALLMRHGADATLATRHGTDARRLARLAGHDELLSALRASAPVVLKRGATPSHTSAVQLPEVRPGAEASQALPSR
jgi:Ankyrin repeats (many copies)/Ankyrin repeats (3 copies)